MQRSFKRISHNVTHINSSSVKHYSFADNISLPKTRLLVISGPSFTQNDALIFITPSPDMHQQKQRIRFQIQLEGFPKNTTFKNFFQRSFYNNCANLFRSYFLSSFFFLPKILIMSYFPTALSNSTAKEMLFLCHNLTYTMNTSNVVSFT